MQAKKLAGPEAASQKYDILTAIGCHALGGPPGLQRLALRFTTLVTARYDWRRGILHVGQREIARLWSVDERTVKREMAKLRALGWLTLESPARRGRVASYALDLTAIRAATRDAWAKVGEDFDARMRGAGRLARVRVSARDVPGSLARITAVVGEAGANIDEVHHQRAFTTLTAQNVEIELVIQTRGREHIAAVLAALQNAGFEAEEQK